MVKITTFFGKMVDFSHYFSIIVCIVRSNRNMKITVLQEVTDWPYKGVYHVNGSNELVAYQASLKAPEKVFKNPIKQFSKSHRKFETIRQYEIENNDPNVIEVIGSNGNVYTIRDGKCSCPGYTYRGNCKHVK
jgi:hypothetical protein